MKNHIESFSSYTWLKLRLKGLESQQFLRRGPFLASFSVIF